MFQEGSKIDLLNTVKPIQNNIIHFKWIKDFIFTHGFVISVYA